MVDVRNPAFAHGQLYVALSRVGRSTDVAILCDTSAVTVDDAGVEWVTTTNVVERKLLEDSIPAEYRRAFRERYPERV